MQEEDNKETLIFKKSIPVSSSVSSSESSALRWLWSVLCCIKCRSVCRNIRHLWSSNSHGLPDDLQIELRIFSWLPKSQNEPDNVVCIAKVDGDIDAEKHKVEEKKDNSSEEPKETKQTVTEQPVFDVTKVQIQDNSTELENIKIENQRQVEPLSKERKAKTKAQKRLSEKASAKSKDNNPKIVDVGHTVELQNLKIENQRLVEALKKEREEKTDALRRLSEIASAKLRDNNPNIVDLSDIYRPVKVAEMFSELYDNEWTNAFCVMEKEFLDRDIISFLLDIVMDSYEFSRRLIQTQWETVNTWYLDEDHPTYFLTRKALKEGIKMKVSKIVDSTYQDYLKRIRDRCADGRLVNLLNDESLTTYIHLCIKLNLLMAATDPPVVIETPGRITMFNSGDYDISGVYAEDTVCSKSDLENGLEDLNNKTNTNVLVDGIQNEDSKTTVGTHSVSKDQNDSQKAVSENLGLDEEILKTKKHDSLRNNNEQQTVAVSGVSKCAPSNISVTVTDSMVEKALTAGEKKIEARIKLEGNETALQDGKDLLKENIETIQCEKECTDKTYESAENKVKSDDDDDSNDDKKEDTLIQSVDSLVKEENLTDCCTTEQIFRNTNMTNRSKDDTNTNIPLHFRNSSGTHTSSVNVDLHTHQEAKKNDQNTAEASDRVSAETTDKTTTSKSNKKRESFNKELFKEYTNKGNFLQYVVWPVMYLHRDGPLLGKGVAQPTDRECIDENEDVIKWWT